MTQMGYTTEFEGMVKIEPPLNEQERKFLEKFSDTRRMNRKKGPYYVDNTGLSGQDDEPDIIDYNEPPKGQPGLWCQWVPTKDGQYIVWDGGEKFYHSPEWMEYLIKHFIGTNPIAKGEIKARGEDMDDRWNLVVIDNKVGVNGSILI